ncbi:MAG: glycosyltransferase family 87 protein [Sumerlaeia bacterium]
MKTPAFLTPARRLLALKIVFGLFLAFSFVRSIDQIWDYNDFEVFYFAGQLAAERSPELFDLDSPVKGRPYLYPPIAAITFIPLGALPYKVAAVAWSVLKVFALAALLLGAVASSRPSPWWAFDLRFWGVVMLTLLVTARFIDGDIKGGQINILVAALSVWGVYGMMLWRRLWWLGALLLSFGVALKLTPLLLLAVPFLHRRWGGLAVCLVASAVFLMVVPRVYYGGEAATHLSERMSAATDESILSAKYRDRQVSLSEVLLFSLAQAQMPDGVFERKGDYYTRDADGERQEYSVPDPISAGAAKGFILAVAVLAGFLFLAVRWKLFQGRGGDWTWDLAMLCAITFLLVPLVRKAHLVLLIVPVAWVIRRVWDEVAADAEGWRGFMRRRKVAAGLALASGVLLLLSDDVALPVPGFAAPLRASLTVALFALIGACVALGRDALQAAPVDR